MAIAILYRFESPRNAQTTAPSGSKPKEILQTLVCYWQSNGLTLSICCCYYCSYCCFCCCCCVNETMKCWSDERTMKLQQNFSRLFCTFFQFAVCVPKLSSAFQTDAIRVIPFQKSSPEERVQKLKLKQKGVSVYLLIVVWKVKNESENEN